MEAGGYMVGCASMWLALFCLIEMKNTVMDHQQKSLWTDDSWLLTDHVMTPISWFTVTPPGDSLCVFKSLSKHQKVLCAGLKVQCTISFCTDIWQMQYWRKFLRRNPLQIIITSWKTIANDPFWLLIVHFSLSKKNNAPSTQALRLLNCVTHNPHSLTCEN